MIISVSEFDGKVVVLVRGTHDKQGLSAILKKEAVLRDGLAVAKVSHAWAVSRCGDTFGIKTWHQVRGVDVGAQEITIGTLRGI